MIHWEEGTSKDMPQVKEPTILLTVEEPYWGNILSVQKTEKGFMFMEECDCVHYKEYTKQQALELVEELKQWIEKQ